MNTDWLSADDPSIKLAKQPGEHHFPTGDCVLKKCCKKYKKGKRCKKCPEE